MSRQNYEPYGTPLQEPVRVSLVRLLASEGDEHVARRAQCSRLVLTRAAAGLPVRRATAALVREILSEPAAAE